MPSTNFLQQPNINTGPPKGLGEQGKYKTWAPENGLCEGRGGVGGTPPGNFEILHALKCVLGRLAVSDQKVRRTGP